MAEVHETHTMTLLGHVVLYCTKCLYCDCHQAAKLSEPCEVEHSVPIIEEVDRNARAYGFEIGRGTKLAEKLDILSEDNPFLDPDWREKIIKEQ